MRVNSNYLALACLFAPSLSTAFHIRRTLCRTPSQLQSRGHGDEENQPTSLDRRHLLLSGFSLALLPSNVNARGLVQFPVDDPTDLLNTYHFLRVGATLLEEEDIWSTNPLFLTNREAALSPTGQEQIQAACAQLERTNRSPGVVKYSLAASSIDSANIVGSTLNIGRDRIVPEYTYLDPRAIGKWDMLSYSKTRPAVWALDALEADKNGSGGRPPANTDGTPNETLEDQAVRLRQLFSVLETFYSGETVLVIFPDSTGGALLSAMIAGVPLNQVHELEFGPGELRMDVTKASILELLKEKQGTDLSEYKSIITAGRDELSRLRSSKDIVSLKDKRLEAERIQIDNQYNEKEAERQEQEEAKRVSREEMAREVREKEEERKLERQRVREQKEERRLEKLRPAVRAEPTTPDGEISGPVVALGTAAVIGTAGLLAVARSEEQAPAKVVSNKSDNPVEPKTKEAASALGIATSNDAPKASETELTETAASKDVETVDLLAEINLEDTVETTPEPIDPFEAAEQAMEEYLNKDDGGEDWLAVMSEIIDEPKDSERSDDQEEEQTK